jgi:preprotein translocase subunit SecG
MDILLLHDSNVGVDNGVCCVVVVVVVLLVNTIQASSSWESRLLSREVGGSPSPSPACCNNCNRFRKVTIGLFVLVLVFVLVVSPLLRKSHSSAARHGSSCSSSSSFWSKEEEEEEEEEDVFEVVVVVVVDGRRASLLSLSLYGPHSQLLLLLFGLLWTGGETTSVRGESECCDGDIVIFVVTVE